MSWPLRTLLPRSTARVCNRPGTLTLRVASSCAARVPITATVCSITSSATVATVTTRADRKGVLPSASLLDPAVARFEQPVSARAEPAATTARMHNGSNVIFPTFQRRREQRPRPQHDGGVQSRGALQRLDRAMTAAGAAARGPFHCGFAALGNRPSLPKVDSLSATTSSAQPHYLLGTSSSRTGVVAGLRWTRPARSLKSV